MQISAAGQDSYQIDLNGGAENIGLGQRVPQQDLHQHAGDREQATDRECAQRTRQPQVDDERANLLRRLAPEHRQALGNADVRTAGTQCEQQGAGCDERESREQQYRSGRRQR